MSILSINSIFIKNDLINGNCLNCSQQPTVYSLFSNVSPGMKIIQNPKNVLYRPVTNKTISRMDTFVTDQDGEEADLRGEHLNIIFHLR